MRALHTEQVHAKAARAVHDNSSVLNAHACPAGHMVDLKSAVNGTATDGRVVPGDLALSSEATPRSKRAPEARKVNLNDVVFTHSAGQCSPGRLAFTSSIGKLPHPTSPPDGVCYRGVGA